MNGYIYDNSWARFIRNNERKVKPSHIALMFAIKQIANEDGWRNEFQLPSKEAMRLSCIRDRETFYRSLKDIAEFGAITIIEDSANQHSARWVSLEELDFYLSEKQTGDNTSDTTAIQTGGITSDHTSGTSSDLPNNKLIETNKTIKSNKPKKARTHEAFDPLSEMLPYNSDSFKEAWTTWCEHRFSKGKKITPQAFKLQIKKLVATGSEKQAIKMIEKAVEHNWEALYDLNERDIADLEKPVYTTIAQKYTNKNSFV